MRSAPALALAGAPLALLVGAPARAVAPLRRRCHGPCIVACALLGDARTAPTPPSPQISRGGSVGPLRARFVGARRFACRLRASPFPPGPSGFTCFPPVLPLGSV